MMTWIVRYRIRNYVRSSLWLLPFVSVLFAMLMLPLLHQIDYATHWSVLEFGQEGARAILNAVVVLTLTIIAFTYTALLITAQIASAQLSPRVIVPLLGNRPVTFSIMLFVFTFLMAVGTLGSSEDTVLQLSVAVSILLGTLTIAVFLFLVDYWLKALRPISVLERMATAARVEIETIYPFLLTAEIDEKRYILETRLGEPARLLLHKSQHGVLLAADFAGIYMLAKKAGGIIELVPRVGEFIAVGEPLFNLYGKAAALDDRALHSALAFGGERTIQQDPIFAFRILVDIAIKALSPAINDPTTAVLAIDQLHRLLRMVGQRRLDIHAILDKSGSYGFIFRTPNWIDFVTLAVSEIRLYGAASFQVVRRLRALLENVRDSLPRDRWPPLMAQLQLLDCAVQRSFPDAMDRTLAMIADYQGVGSDEQSPVPLPVDTSGDSEKS
ncbi:MAG: DUF2254 domain-containing protein [Gammaproteobacteria bacterium]